MSLVTRIGDQARKAFRLPWSLLREFCEHVPGLQTLLQAYDNQPLLRKYIAPYIRLVLTTYICASIGKFIRTRHATSKASKTMQNLFVWCWYIICGLALRSRLRTAKEYKGSRDISQSSMKASSITTGLSLTRKELRRYNGTTPNLPIYVAILGKIYDVSSSRHNYEPGGTYHAFAGKEGNRGMALMSTDPDHVVPEIDGLNETQRRILHSWVEYYEQRYPCIGTVIP
eukprot:TRINITY_DN3265_c0_g1_i1.p1 TRINITY_DN3265_c0_g1~~TRINITY_DN3265_c0_g1_i1.p1  ORF type:complete len:228 (+),score=27.70 TRINITY_DN3265_c0_g1_i1:63-746(+)